MNRTYTYIFYLDSNSLDADQQITWDSVEVLGSIKKLILTVPAVDSIKVQDYIDWVVDNCTTYRLIVVGEHQGHLEIYQSEDYTGSLNVQIQGQPLWNI